MIVNKSVSVALVCAGSAASSSAKTVPQKVWRTTCVKIRSKNSFFIRSEKKINAIFVLVFRKIWP